MSNNTSHLSSDCASSASLETSYVAVSYLYFILFPVALFLNGVAAWVSLHLRSTTTFIVYLKNLVGADLIMTLTLPSLAASRLPGASAELRAFACRYNNVVFFCCMYTSITLMGLISLDRFFKIVRPRGKALGQSVTFSVVTSTSVWVVLFGGTAIPTVVLTDRDPANASDDFCMAMKSPAGLSLHKFVVFFMETLFWLVSMLIVFCYICITVKVLRSFRNSGSNNSRGKKKTKLRVFLILVVFCVCFVPLHLMRIPFMLNKIYGVTMCTQTWVEVVYDLNVWLSSTNACLDPWLYIYLCREFRDKFVDLMKGSGSCVGLFSEDKEESSQ
ncbi:P2Y purinoceptor 12-like [Mugil cephalus]|uniref:P2Y purinoceptor 12-like n=1 Tax=Mugil cephalus TaxID=48193 RepID=UPI001FB744F6|nr:P2Y purinoceptor 12-like [Mugil cephalus]